MTWREAGPTELARLWPAVRVANVAASHEGFLALARRTPWAVRVTGAGDAMVLRPWRAHSSALSIRGAWAPGERMAALVSEALDVAAAQGYGLVLSPLVPEPAFRFYARAGMSECERVVPMQASADAVRAVLKSTASDRDSSRLVASERPDAAVRDADDDDLERLLELDHASFPAFWRYGREELLEAFAAERVTVAERAGRVLGYATYSLRGATMSLGRLAVDPSARRQGLGRLLVSEGASWTLRHGGLGIVLCTQADNGGARALYEHAGFSAAGEYLVIGSVPVSVSGAGAHGGP